MGEIAYQIISLDIVYSTLYSGADQSKHQSSASLAFVWGIHRGPVNSPHKWPVTRKMFPFDDVIMNYSGLPHWHCGNRIFQNDRGSSEMMLKGNTDGLVQERRNASALTLSYVFLALNHRYDICLDRTTAKHNKILTTCVIRGM